MEIFGEREQPVEPQEESMAEEGTFNTKKGYEAYFKELEKAGLEPKWVEEKDENGNMRYKIKHKKLPSHDPFKQEIIS